MSLRLVKATVCDFDDVIPYEQGNAFVYDESEAYRAASSQEIERMQIALNDPDSVRQWVPTKERNPETPGEYWTQLDKHAQCLATWGGSAWTQYTEMGGFDCSPLAWMPLPAPYKEDV